MRKAPLRSQTSRPDSLSSGTSPGAHTTLNVQSVKLMSRARGAIARNDAWCEELGVNAIEPDVRKLRPGTGVASADKHRFGDVSHLDAFKDDVGDVHALDRPLVFGLRVTALHVEAASGPFDRHV